MSNMPIQRSAIHFGRDDDVMYRRIAGIAADAFEKDFKLETYRHMDYELDEYFICLRYGIGRDCVRIYKLDEHFQPLQYNQIVDKSVAVTDPKKKDFTA